MEGKKIRDSIELVWRAIEESRRPAAMLSFGKDSMVLAHLIRVSHAHADFPKAHGFPIDVIYHRDPWFPVKHEFAQRVIRTWSMEVHDYPPFQCGVKAKPDMLELVARYNFGTGSMDIPKNVCAPEEYPRRDYICGLNDWLLRPQTFIMDYPWDMVLMGHRNADVDSFDGPVPLRVDETQVGGVRMVFPLRHWSDDDVWDYIEEQRIPIDIKRYGGRDRWYDNDYTHACTRCIDPREMRPTVFCPKLKEEVKNRGREVRILEEHPHYIGRELET